MLRNDRATQPRFMRQHFIFISALRAFARQSQDCSRASPREREARAAVAVVVNDRAPVAQTIAFEADARFAKWAKANPFGQNPRLADAQNAAAFANNAQCRRWIDI